MNDFPVFTKNESPYWPVQIPEQGEVPVESKGALTIRRIALVRPGVYPEGLIVPLSLIYLASYC